MPFDLQLPVITELERASSVLLAGAGGGSDIFAALPLYGALRRAGKSVHLANISSTPFESSAKVITPTLVRVTAGTAADAPFPELLLSRFFAKSEEDVPVYCFERTGYKPLRDAYATLADLLRLDAVVLVDGGTDSLLRGDEVRLGTPEEDAASLAAVASLALPAKLLVAVGFGIDAFHGVADASVLAAIADLAKRGDFLGAWSLVGGTSDVETYERAVAFALRDRQVTSIVNTSVLSAIHGEFGDHHATARTAGSTLSINPLMTLCWAFRLDGVVARNLYIDGIRDTESFADLQLMIERFRHSLPG